MLRASNFIHQFLCWPGAVVVELVEETHTGVLASAEAPVSSPGGSFLIRFVQAIMKTTAETETAQTLFNDQRMEKWETSLWINFSTQLGWRHQMFRRVKVKRMQLEIKECSSYPRTRVWFGPGTDTVLLFSPCIGFSSKYSHLIGRNHRRMWNKNLHLLFHLYAIIFLSSSFLHSYANSFYFQCLKFSNYCFCPLIF